MSISLSTDRVEAPSTQRLNAIFDADPEFISTAADCGVAVALGEIRGVQCLAFCTDHSHKGGALGVRGAAAIVDGYRVALDRRIPVVGLWHSGGARIDEGVPVLDAIGRMFTAMTMASGRIFQLSVVLGPAAGGAAYGPGLTDFVIQAESGRVFVTGPQVIKAATHEIVSDEDLGGADTHSRISGVSHIRAATEESALEHARELVHLIHNRGHLVPPLGELDLAAFLPANRRRAYDVHPLISHLLDAGSTSVELQREWAPNIVTLLGRFAGMTVGVIANNPIRLGGCLDAKSAEKAARFVRFCTGQRIPLMVLTDVPGYLPGSREEHNGVVRRGAKLLHAFAQSDVPRVTLITRKAFGGAYIAMNSASLGATKVFAWPGAEVDVMGAPAAVQILHRRTIQAARVEDQARLVDDLAAAHTAGQSGLRSAVHLGLLEVVDPKLTRQAMAAALSRPVESLQPWLSNIPL